ncbi:MAG TPA: erythromycin esterase family protein [Thermomicrobiales bacterium]|nr:erythromycin esterase family protein [Thermomicrobiales bacterium]
MPHVVASPQCGPATAARRRRGWPPPPGYHEALLLRGFDFYAGSFYAVGGTGEAPRVYQASPAPPDSYEAAFRQADLPRMILDLRDAPPDTPGTAWLPGPRRFRQIGAGYDPAHPDDYFIRVSLPREFDVVVSFQDTSPSHPLFPFGPPADSAGAPTGCAVIRRSRSPVPAARAARVRPR